MHSSDDRGIVGDSPMLSLRILLIPADAPAAKIWVRVSTSVPSSLTTRCTSGRSSLMTRDETLCTQIREALNHDQRVSARSIDVHATSGIVTIRGCSVSRGSMLAAVQIAASFPACRGVVNRQVLARFRPRQTESMWSLPAGDGLIGRTGWACLPNDGQPASLYDNDAVPGFTRTAPAAARRR